MSQFFIDEQVAPPPLPPTVATSYVTQNGTAVPALNILIVDGFDSIENNDNGIITKGGVAGTGVSNELDVVITNRIVVTATTVGATTTTGIVFTPSTDIVFRFTATIVGRDTGNGLASGGEILGLAKNVATVTSIVSSNDAFDDEDSGQPAINWDITTDGTNILASFTGVVGRTINWKCLFTYVQVS